jgi:hypothetical protein
LPPFAPEERPTKYKDRVNRWWKKMWSQKRLDAMVRIEEEMHADQARLHAVFAERADGLELADCLLRYYENVAGFAHYTGFRRGYNVGIKVGKDECEVAITRVIRKRLNATPKEICELIDKYNSRFDDQNDRRLIQLKWPELRRQYRTWAEVGHKPKVKNYLVRIRRKANEISQIQSLQRPMEEHESNRKPTSGKQSPE